MSQQIIKDHNIEALKVAGSWPGADRATLITLATVLAATGADHDGLRHFEALAASQPDQVLPLTLAGFFQVRAGEDGHGSALVVRAVTRHRPDQDSGFLLGGRPAAGLRPGGVFHPQDHGTYVYATPRPAQITLLCVATATDQAHAKERHRAGLRAPEPGSQ